MPEKLLQGFSSFPLPKKKFLWGGLDLCGRINIMLSCVLLKKRREDPVADRVAILQQHTDTHIYINR